MGNLSVTTDEARYAEELAFFGGLTETIDLDTETMTRKQVLDDFNSGATLSAIIDSWDLGAVNGDTCQVAALPSCTWFISSRICIWCRICRNGISRSLEKVLRKR